MAVMKVETYIIDSIAVILVTMYVKTFKTDIIVFIATS